MNTYQLPDGQRFTVVGDNILVERIELPRTYAGGLIVVNREKEDATAIGIVRAVGELAVKKPKDGDPMTVPIEPALVPGARCAFLWFYAQRHTNIMVQHSLGNNFILLKAADIALVWPAEEEHEIADIRSMST